MAQPKRRWSKQRTHTKRSTWKLEETNLSTCANCGEPVLSHKACPSCGYYNKKQVVEIKEQKENEIKKCKKQINNLDKKIDIEKSKHTISYNQIKKIFEEFLSANNITKPILNKLIDKIEFDSNRNINLKLVYYRKKLNFKINILYYK